MTTKRELLIQVVLSAVAEIEGWDDKHPAIKQWGPDLPLPSKALRSRIWQKEALYEAELKRIRKGSTLGLEQVKP